MGLEAGSKGGTKQYRASSLKPVRGTRSTLPGLGTVGRYGRASDSRKVACMWDEMRLALSFNVLV